MESGKADNMRVGLSRAGAEAITREKVLAGLVLGPDGRWGSRAGLIMRERDSVRRILNGRIAINGKWVTIKQALENRREEPVPEAPLERPVSRGTDGPAGDETEAKQAGPHDRGRLVPPSGSDDAVDMPGKRPTLLDEEATDLPTAEEAGGPVSFLPELPDDVGRAEGETSLGDEESGHVDLPRGDEIGREAVLVVENDDREGPDPAKSEPRADSGPRESKPSAGRDEPGTFTSVESPAGRGPAKEVFGTLTEPVPEERAATNGPAGVDDPDPILETTRSPSGTRPEGRTGEVVTNGSPGADPESGDEVAAMASALAEMVATGPDGERPSPPPPSSGPPPVEPGQDGHAPAGDTDRKPDPEPTEDPEQPALSTDDEVDELASSLTQVIKKVERDKAMRDRRSAHPRR